MGMILCATRGGEASFRAQDKAIKMAKERGHKLVFLYVIDLHFLDKTAAPLVVDVEEEVREMGEFILLMAKERASKQNIIAKTMCRKGKAKEEIIKIAHKEDIELVVLGKPAGDDSAFRLSGLKKFAAKIEKETGTKTVIV
ncbi:MAG: universal stress protein [Anaerolineales bacterium]